MDSQRSNTSETPFGSSANKNPEIESHFREGAALHQAGQLDQAYEIYCAVLKRDPGHFNALHLSGLIAAGRRQFEDARDFMARAIAVRPAHAIAHYNYGTVLEGLKQYRAAIDNYDVAIRLKPDFAEAYNNRGSALDHLGQHQAAIESYSAAINIKADLAEAHNNRGNAMRALKRYADALADYNTAIRIRPDYAEAYNNRGVVFSALDQPHAAKDDYDRAIALKGDFTEAHYNLANVLREQKRYLEAIDSFDKAHFYQPDFPALSGLRTHTKMQVCDWNDLHGNIAQLSDQIENGLPCAPPFSVLALIDTYGAQRKMAEIWAKQKHPRDHTLGDIAPYRHQKIRVGYFSMDFASHPVSHLIAEVIALHDRKNFEVYAFSFGPPSEDDMRKRLEIAFDQFIDVRSKSDLEIAELARTMEIDIAIDLAGYTYGARTNIFAMRAAPIQAHYLGYPGTMSADYIDYILADEIVIPEHQQTQYTEKVIYIPDCFQANPTTRVAADKVFGRAELGLPPAGFVFCCFNNTYKFLPETFDVWMRILRRVENSVLFLYADNAIIVANLKREAIARGVDGERLVFGTRLDFPEYLARYRAPDLFLDTLPYNAGTTASDALWMGLPVLTCKGETFAARMGASLLTSVGLPELITTTYPAYEDMAVTLATKPDVLRDIKQRLANNISTTSLFKARLITRRIEDAYRQAYERRHAGLPVAHITAADAPS
jgi:predicted O-linked N-acetylglucosamine transferase (SPINDLY family)